MLPEKPVYIKFMCNCHTVIHEYQTIEYVLNETADDYVAKLKGCYIECIHEY